MFSNIRVRLTLWYLLIFGSLLIAFSFYIYSSVSIGMRNRFDNALLRVAQQMSIYFTEFVERDGIDKGAKETISALKEGRESAAIFRQGQLLYANDNEVLEALESTQILQAVGPERRYAFDTDPRFNKRLVVFPFQVNGMDHVVAVFEPLDKLEGQIGNMRNIIFFGMPGALLLAAGGGFLLVRKSLAPMVSISEQAAHISAQNLDQRLEIRNPNDELGRLTGVFNALLSRLDASFHVMREFMADASHELRTPITIIHGEAEVSLSQANLTSEEARQSLCIVRDQSKRIARIVSDMLVLARADAGEHHLRVQELYLNDLVEECCRAAKSLALPKGVRLKFEVGDDIPFAGDEELLRGMVINLLDNAIRYTPVGGLIEVTLASGKAGTQLAISDTGIGIPSDCLGRVFDRFYRVDDSRARMNGGSGLGLAIVKLAAESHGGSVVVISQPGKGSTFTVSLPSDSAVRFSGTPSVGNGNGAIPVTAAIGSRRPVGS